ncbi:hypothetical protein AGMMS50255_4910 [Spirochaetia bacterium]|nr:hypothetical protein AGMMS50255_4910 [Spirochaetia bacterium]
MKRNMLMAGMLAVVLALGLVLAGCDDGGGGNGGNKPSLAEVKTELKAQYAEDPASFALMLAAWKSAGLTLTLVPDPKDWSDSDWADLYAWLDAKGYLDENNNEGTGSEPTGFNIPETNAQVIDGETGGNYTGSGAVTGYLYDPSGASEWGTVPTSISVGNIAGGKLTLSLPATVEASKLFALTSDGGINVSVGDLKAALVIFKNTDESEITYKKSNNLDTVEYWYFSKAANITGKVVDEYGGTSEWNYQVTGKAGWNRVYVKSEVQADGWSYKYTYTTNGTLPSGMQWILGGGH